MITNQWYMACLLAELKEQNPLKKKILGQELVIFRTESGKIGVVEDRCCHRNVNLSLGYIQGESIKCAYHGWEYNTEGACTCIPSLPESGTIPRTARIERFPVQVKYQAVWVWLGDEALKDSVALPPMHEMEEWPMVYNYHMVNAGLPLVAESLIDAYHINHVHRNSIKTFMGNLYGEVVDFRLQVSDTFLTGTYHRHFDGSIWEKLYFGFDKKVTTHIGFWFPHTSKLDIVFRKRRMVIYEHFYQVDEHTVSMCQITLWQNIFSEFPLPFFAKSFMLRKSNRIVEEDLVFLENNKAVKARTGKRDLLIPSDEVTFEFTKLWNRNTHQHERKAKAGDTQ
jgi:phenylpropionate dioxygenase-like ring-hydroxylating dioxygenase large terminal subunit